MLQHSLFEYMIDVRRSGQTHREVAIQCWALGKLIQSSLRVATVRVELHRPQHAPQHVPFEFSGLILRVSKGLRRKFADPNPLSP